tara:strand:+ start:3163 stop:3855 length:693 start_codon:yes stop_codon:yes gene_type:complete
MKEVLFIFLCAFVLFTILKNNTKNIEGFGTKTRMAYSKFIKLKQEIYTDILSKTEKVMNRLNIPFFLSSGTLLGYYREGKILDHDYDLDVGIFKKDYTVRLIDEMEKEGFYNYRNLGDVERGFEMSFYLPKSKIGKYAKIDIFVHNNEQIGFKKYMYWASYRKPDYVKRIKYRVSAFNIKPIKFNGVRVGIPSDTELYLREHYGSDWKTPKKPGKGGYYYATSPKSIVEE